MPAAMAANNPVTTQVNVKLAMDGLMKELVTKTYDEKMLTMNDHLKESTANSDKMAVFFEEGILGLGESSRVFAGKDWEATLNAMPTGSGVYGDLVKALLQVKTAEEVEVEKLMKDMVENKKKYIEAMKKQIKDEDKEVVNAPNIVKALVKEYKSDEGSNSKTLWWVLGITGGIILVAVIGASVYYLYFRKPKF